MNIGTVLSNDNGEMVFLGSYRDQAVDLTLKRRSIYNEDNEGTEDSPYTGSMRVYFDPNVITTHPYSDRGIHCPINASVLWIARGS